GSAFDPRRSARLARHSIDHAETEAGSFSDLLGGEEGLERSLGNVGRHSGPSVVDRKLDIIAVLEIRVAGDAKLARGKAKNASVGHGVARVYRQIEDRDLELGR